MRSILLSFDKFSESVIYLINLALFLPVILKMSNELKTSSSLMVDLMLSYKERNVEFKAKTTLSEQRITNISFM